MLQEPAQRLRILPCGWSCNFSMAVFADLDLRASSDLKALRGLVENAAHRESPRLRGLRCLPSLTAPSDRQATFGRDLAMPGLVRVSGMSLEADAQRGFACTPSAGNLKAQGAITQSGSFFPVN